MTEHGGSVPERPAGETSYGVCGAPSCTMAWVATVRILEAEVERLRGERDEARTWRAEFERLADQRGAEVEWLQEALSAIIAASEHHSMTIRSTAVMAEIAKRALARTPITSEGES